jgi:hypothetical protein
MSAEEGRAQLLYQILRKTFDEMGCLKWARRVLGAGAPIGIIYRRHEWFCDVSRRLEGESDKRFFERDIGYVGFLNKELKGLVDLIARFDVELAHKEAELIEKDELYDGLVALLDATLRDKLDDGQLVKLGGIVDDALVAREIALREEIERRDAALALKDEELADVKRELEREREAQRQAVDKFEALVDALTLRIEKFEIAHGTGNDNGAVA